MLIYIVRHGETDENAAGKLCGQIDVNLNSNGRLLADITGDALKDIKFDEVISSPLSRAYETAQIIISHSSNNPTIKTDSRLMELSWGSWELLGCIPSNYELPCGDFNDFYKDPFVFKYPEDGETMKQLCDRAEAFFVELSNRSLPDDYKILVTTHGCTTRALLQNVYLDKNDFWHGSCPANCAVNVVEIKNNEAMLLLSDKLYYDMSLCNNLFHKS